MAKITRGRITVELDINDMLKYITKDAEIDSNYVIGRLNELFDFELEIPENSDFYDTLDVSDNVISFYIEEN